MKRPTQANLRKTLRIYSRPSENRKQNLSTNDNAQTNKEKTPSTRTRGSSRFKIEARNEDKFSAEDCPSCDSSHRKFRPDITSQIADLSSLTAVDISLRGKNNRRTYTRRRRPEARHDYTNRDKNENESEEHIKLAESNIRTSSVNLISARPKQRVKVLRRIKTQESNSTDFSKNSKNVEFGTKELVHDNKETGLDLKPLVTDVRKDAINRSRYVTIRRNSTSLKIDNTEQQEEGRKQEQEQEREQVQEQEQEKEQKLEQEQEQEQEQVQEQEQEQEPEQVQEQEQEKEQDKIQEQEQEKEQEQGQEQEKEQEKIFNFANNFQKRRKYVTIRRNLTNENKLNTHETINTPLNNVSYPKGENSIFRSHGGHPEFHNNRTYLVIQRNVKNKSNTDDSISNSNSSNIQKEDTNFVAANETSKEIVISNSSDIDYINNKSNITEIYLSSGELSSLKLNNETISNRFYNYNVSRTTEETTLETEKIFSTSTESNRKYISRRRNSTFLNRNEIDSSNNSSNNSTLKRNFARPLQNDKYNRRKNSNYFKIQNVTNILSTDNVADIPSSVLKLENVSLTENNSTFRVNEEVKSALSEISGDVTNITEKYSSLDITTETIILVNDTLNLNESKKVEGGPLIAEEPKVNKEITSNLTETPLINTRTSLSRKYRPNTFIKNNKISLNEPYNRTLNLSTSNRDIFKPSENSSGVHKFSKYKSKNLNETINEESIYNFNQSTTIESDSDDKIDTKSSPKNYNRSKAKDFISTSRSSNLQVNNTNISRPAYNKNQNKFRSKEILIQKSTGTENESTTKENNTNISSVGVKRKQIYFPRYQARNITTQKESLSNTEDDPKLNQISSRKEVNETENLKHVFAINKNQKQVIPTSQEKIIEINRIVEVHSNNKESSNEISKENENFNFQPIGIISRTQDVQIIDHYKTGFTSNTNGGSLSNADTYVTRNKTSDQEDQLQNITPVSYQNQESFTIPLEKLFEKDLNIPIENRSDVSAATDKSIEDLEKEHIAKIVEVKVNMNDQLIKLKPVSINYNISQPNFQ